MMYKYRRDKLMKEFVASIDNYKFSILDTVPTVPENQCILLYKEGFDKNSSVVIDNYTKLMKRDILRGKFNRIVYLSMQEQSASYSFQIVMKEGDFYFNAKVGVRYSLKNVREYYFEQSEENGDDIKKRIYNAVRNCDKQYTMHECIKLRNDLQFNLEMQFNSYHALRVTLDDVLVEVDSDVQAILDSEKKMVVDIAKHKNETDVIVSQNANQEKINDSENRLMVQNIQYLLKLASQFGILAPIFAEYSKGKLSGMQLYEYIDQNRMKELSALKDAADSQLLSVEEVGIRASQIFNDSIGIASKQVQIETRQEDKKETDNVIVDCKLEDEEYI